MLHPPGLRLGSRRPKPRSSRAAHSAVIALPVSAQIIREASLRTAASVVSSHTGVP